MLDVAPGLTPSTTRHGGRNGNNQCGVEYGTAPPSSGLLISALVNETQPPDFKKTQLSHMTIPHDSIPILVHRPPRRGDTSCGESARHYVRNDLQFERENTHTYDRDNHVNTAGERQTLARPRGKNSPHVFANDGVKSRCSQVDYWTVVLMDV